MLERASGQFTIEGNVEDIFGGISGAARIARISQTCLFTGTLEGESIAEYTAVLPREGDGSFQGFQRISGALGEREGTFVVCVTGDYAKGQTRGSWAIVPKSGSGDFAHIRGGGTFAQSHGKAGAYKLEFDLRKPRKSRDVSASDESDAGELIPGIDIVAEVESTPARELVAAEPIVETPAAKPSRPTRKKTRAAEPAATEPVVAAIEPPVPPKRSRRTPAPVVTEAVAEVRVVEPKPARKRARKPAVTDIEADATPVMDAPRKRARKAPVQPPEPTAPEPAPVTESKPVRRRKPAPLDPVPLPVAQDKPARQRKAKAA